MEPKWTISLATLAVSALTQGCFWGNITDAETGRALDGATVRIENCESCAAAVTDTPSDPSYPGTYAFDFYEGGPLILPDGVEAVRIEASAPGYLTRELFHAVYYDREYQGKRYDTRDIALVPEPYDPRLMTDADGDGLRRIEELRIGTDPNRRDTDGDALPDGWEVNGHGWVDYPSLGADPLRKDIFVECDYMAGWAPIPGSIEDVVAAFSRAPVRNPDGSEGVDLHVYVDDEIPLASQITKDEFREIRAQRSSPDRRRGFHYCVIGDEGIESSGFAAGADFLAGALRNNTRLELAAHFMHELGHTLGLKHGGSDKTNYKPNYLSVMNYMFDDFGLIVDGTRGVLDYSRFQLAPVNELLFHETNGLHVMDGPHSMLSGYSTCVWVPGGMAPGNCTESFTEISDPGTAQDWNQDGIIHPSTVMDMNNDGFHTILTGWNDWANLDYSSRSRIGLR